MKKFFKKLFRGKKSKLVERLEALENEVGINDEKEEKENTTYTSLWSRFLTISYNFSDDSLKKKVKQLRADFKELDNKFDYLERYLQIKYVKKTTETQIYDWADKKQTEGFVKADAYDKVKKGKEVKCDDEE